MGLPYVVRTCAAVLVGTPVSIQTSVPTLGLDKPPRLFSCHIADDAHRECYSAMFCLLISFINVPVPLS